MPVDVCGNFENRGFTIDKQISNDGSFWIGTLEKDGINYEVKTYCESGIDKVSTIRLTATRSYPQYNSVNDLKWFLKYGCSIPYEAADIEMVNKFIDKNYYKNRASTIISNVRFTLYTPTEFMIMVEIEKN